MKKKKRPFYDHLCQCQKCWWFDHVIGRCKIDVRCTISSGVHLEASCSCVGSVCGHCNYYLVATNPPFPCHQQEVKIPKFKMHNQISITEDRRRFRSTDTCTFATAMYCSETLSFSVVPLVTPTLNWGIFFCVKAQQAFM